MLKLPENKKRLAKKILVALLVASNITFGFPIQGFLTYLRERNIVDVLYKSSKNAKVIDSLLSKVNSGKVVDEALADGTTDAMMVYDTQDITSTPKYRIWGGSSWGVESSANTVSGEIRYMVVKYAPTRDEAIMMTLGSTGLVQAQIFNGTSWGSVTTLGTVANANGDRDVQSQYRGFDVEYEQTSGDAIVVYGDGTADPDYQVWNGTSWSGATDINIPDTGVPNWIELASRPGSDELAMILIDANVDVFGARWTGSAWDLMGQAAVWDATGAIATEKSVDVAFETTSGDILFIWADSVSTDNYYKTYSGGALSANTLLDQTTAGAVGNWVRLAANPTSGSDQIMFGVLDGGSDMNTALWSGTAWGAFTEHSAAAEANDEMAFDIVFETHSSNPNDAWLLYGDGATVARRLWDGGGSTWQTITTSGDDTVNIALNAQPNSGAVFAVVYEDVTSATDDIRDMNLTSGSQTWSAMATTWGGPVGRRAYFLVNLASQVYSSSTEAMMVYDTRNITSVPKYRRWTGSTWGSEVSAQSINGEIRHMVLKFAPTRNEAILATLGSTGEVQTQVWNGSSWGSPTLMATMNNANGDRDTQSLYRGFDLEYESTSGDAIVVYGDGTADPDYNVWNGSSWGTTTDINIPTTGRPNWIELASDPNSDELAMIVLDANIDVYGMRWTGSAWDNMGVATVWDATGSSAVRKSVDVAFETLSGDIMFIWGDSVSTDQYYRTYTTSLSAATLLDIATAGGVGNWVKLAPNPGSSSDQIMYGVQDAGADLNTAIWDGSTTWTVHAEHSAGTEDIIDMNFDIVFETHSSNPGDAWLVWGNSTTVSRKLYDTSTGWGTATTSGDDTALVVLNVQPNSGAVFALIYEDDTSAADDITTIQLTGGSQTWSSPTQIWTGPVAFNRGSFRMTVASERFISATTTFTLNAYRWYVDSNLEDVSNAWGNPDIAQNTAISIIPATDDPPNSSQELRLRVNFTVNGAVLSASATRFKLQFKAGTDGSCTTGSWTDVNTSQTWEYATSTVTDGTDLTVSRLSPVSDVLQEYIKSRPTGLNPFSATVGQEIEYDFHIIGTSIVDATQYSFRAVETDAAGTATTVFDAYTNCPTLTTEPGTANLLRHGNIFASELEKGFFWAD